MNRFPVLYSFRRCPYAMRARMSIASSGIAVELREFSLNDKPAELIDCSAKATVPVMVLQDGRVIDESRDIMDWSLAQNDPHGWLGKDHSVLSEMKALVDMNDDEFKNHLDHYKYADRFPQLPAVFYRAQADVYLKLLEQCLAGNIFLYGNSVSYADIAVSPFIRQFAAVDVDWFERSHYIQLQDWLKACLSQSCSDRSCASIRVGIPLLHPPVIFP